MAMYEVNEAQTGKIFEMLNDNIMVKRFKEKNTTESGIIISVDEEKVIRRQEGIVLYVGPGKERDDGTIKPMKVKVGDVVWFGEWAGVEFNVPNADGGKDQVLFMREDDICAIVREDN